MEKKLSEDATRPASSNDTNMQTIARAVAILRAVERDPDGLSLGAIAKTLSLPRSSVQRLVDALKSEGFLIPASPRGGVRLGPMLLRLASSAEHESAKHVRPIIRALSARLRETVDVSTLQGGGAVFVDQATGRQRLVAMSAVGERFPLFVTAPGKALLSIMERPRAEALLARSIREFPGWPELEPAAFWDEIDECRARGCAYDEEEHNAGIAAVGVAIDDPYGLPLMISVPSPAERFARNRENFSKELLKAKREIARVLHRR